MVIDLDVGAQYFLLLPSTSTPKTVQSSLVVRVVAVNNTTGHLCFTGIPGVDLFSSLDAAKMAVATNVCASSSRVEIENVLEFCSFAGGYASDEAIHLAFVTEEVTAGEEKKEGDTSPLSSTVCGAILKRVCSISWVNFALRIPASTLMLQLEELSFNSSSTPTSTPSPAQQHQQRGTRSAARSVAGSSSGFSDHHHQQPLYFRDMAHGILAGSDVNGAKQQYFFYSRVCDASHSSAVEAAAIAVAAVRAGRHEDSTQPLPSTDDRQRLFTPTCVLLRAENSIAMTEFLWNVELIRFCEFFGLGDCCCRLCVGSVHQNSLLPTEIMWVARLSRFALCPPSSRSSHSSASHDRRSVRGKEQVAGEPGPQPSQHDEWQHSPLETEGQLLLIDKDTVNERRLVRSMIARRGGDFSRHPDLISFNNVSALSAKDFTYRPLTSAFAAEYFTSMVSRYGKGCVIELVPTSEPQPGAVIIPAARIDSAPPQGGAPVVARSTSSPMDSPRGSLSVPKRDSPRKQQRHGDPSLENNTPPSLTHTQPLTSIISGEHSPALQRLMGFLSAAGLSASFSRGALFQRVRECFLPEVSSPSHGCTAEREPQSSSRFSCFRVLADDDRDAVGTLVTACVIALVWAAVEETIHRGAPCPASTLDTMSHQWKAMVLLFLQSCWSPIATDQQPAVAKIIILFAADMVNLLTSQQPVVDDPCSPLVPLAVRRQQTIQRDTKESLNVLGNCIGSVIAAIDPLPPNTPFLEEVVQSLLRATLADPRRCNSAFSLRPMLLTHPASGAAIIRSQLLLSPEGSELPSTRSDPIFAVPQSPTRSATAAEARCNSKFASDSTQMIHTANGEVPSTATWMLVKDLCHPQLEPVLLPEGTEGINFTISLPSVSVLTHLGLLVQSASQSGVPFSSALTVSCTVGEYIAAAFGRAVLQEAPLPISIGNSDGSPSMVLIPLIFTVHQNVATVLSYRYEDDAPVVGRFVKITLRGSGKIPLMVSPISVFGFPLSSAPELLLRHIQTVDVAALLKKHRNADLKSAADAAAVNAETQSGKIASAEEKFGTAARVVVDSLLGRLLPAKQGPEDTFSNNIGKLTTAMSLASSGSQTAAFSAEICTTLLNPDRRTQSSLHHLVTAEYTRLRHRVSRRSRDRCYSKLQRPLWLLNPSCAVFPTPTTLAATSARKEHGGGDGKRCFKCDSRMMFLTTKVECRRCYQIFCQRCIAPQLSEVLEHGVREATASVCFSCQQLISNLQRLISGTMVSNEKSWHQFHPDCRIIVPFTNTSAIAPSCELFESVAGVTPDTLKDCDGYNLCVGDVCQVVDCPDLDLVRDLAPSHYVPFEKILGGVVHLDSVGWCLLSSAPGGTSVSSPEKQSGGAPTSGQRSSSPSGSVDITHQVLLRLAAPAFVQRWDISYTLTSAASPVTLRIVAGPNMLQLDTIQLESILQPRAASSKVSVKVKTAGDSDPVQIVALRFSGCSSALECLGVQNVSLWGCYVGAVGFMRPQFAKSSFLQVPNAVPPSQKQYAAVDFLHFARHAVNSTPSTYFSGGHMPSNGGGGGGAGHAPAHTKALPVELPGARLIAVKNLLPIVSCTGSHVVEYELSTPMTLCGFVLENCYAAYLPLTSTNRLATVLRFIGTSSSGFQDNIGVFRLPIVLVHSGELNEAPPPAVAFAFPTSNHTLVSVMVEVMEWRYVPNSCSSPDPPPHFGKVHFWTSPTVKTRRVVSSGSSFSAHSSVAEGTVVVTKKKGTALP